MFVRNGITLKDVRFAFCGDDVLLGFSERSAESLNFDQFLVEVSIWQKKTLNYDTEAKFKKGVYNPTDWRDAC